MDILSGMILLLDMIAADAYLESENAYTDGYPSDAPGIVNIGETIVLFPLYMLTGKVEFSLN